MFIISVTDCIYILLSGLDIRKIIVYHYHIYMIINNLPQPDYIILSSACTSALTSNVCIYSIILFMHVPNGSDENKI